MEQVIEISENLAEVTEDEQLIELSSDVLSKIGGGHGAVLL